MVVLRTFKKTVLQKIKASSLVETLVATVIIVLLFSIASMTLNNVFSHAVKSNTDAIYTQLNYLRYQYQNSQFEIPYYDTFKEWDIEIQRITVSNENYVVFEAVNSKNQKSITQKFFDVSK